MDPAVAANLEVRWWQAHRERQHGRHSSDAELTDALVALYAYVYRAEPSGVCQAAELRVHAMGLSDAWVSAGCRLDDPTLASERLSVVASSTALREASDRGALHHG